MLLMTWYTSFLALTEVARGCDPEASSCNLRIADRFFMNTDVGTLTSEHALTSLA